MSGEVLVCQENICAESIAASGSRRIQDIAKIHFICDGSTETRGFQSEISKLQFKKIDWNLIKYSNFNATFPPSRANDWSIILLPSLSSHTEFNCSHWHKVLNQCCKTSKAVFIISLEGTDSHDTSSAVLMANAVYGSLLCAQWEYPQCLLRLFRLRGTSEQLSSQQAKQLAQKVFEEASVGPSKRIEVFFEIDSSSGNWKTSSHVYVKNPVFTDFLSTNNPFSHHSGQLPVEKNGVFLITGGLGSLGLISAHVLLDFGIRRIALISRSGKASTNDHPLEQQLYEKAQRYPGAMIKVYCCDVSKREELTSLFANIAKDLCEPSHHPFKGIIHSAGILRDGLLCSGKAEAGANDVWSTKITSVSLLNEIITALSEKETAENVPATASIFQSFQYFINFSSLAACVGNVGQSTYAAANRALEHIVPVSRDHDNRHCAAPAAWNYNTIHIRWPGIIGSNMGKVFDASLNTIMMSLEQVSQFMMHLLKQWDDILVYEEHTLTPVPIGLLEKMKGSWMIEKFHVGKEHNTLEPTRRISIPCRPSSPVPVPVPPVVAAPVAISASTNTAGGEEEAMISQVKDLIRKLLGEDAEEAIRLNLPILTMGLDSMMAAELALELSLVFQMDLPPTFLYSYPTIDVIGKYLCNAKYPTVVPSIPDEAGFAAPLGSGGLFRSVAPNSNKASPLSSSPLKTKIPFPPEIDTGNSNRFGPSSSPSSSSSSSVSSESITYDAGSSSPTETTTATAANDFDEVGVIGIGFDFANDLQSLTDLFELLATKSTTISQVSKMNLLEHHPYLQQYLDTNVKEDELTSETLIKKLQSGHFLTSHQKERFDGSEFKVTANEAESMDLSQKLLLMNTKKAMIDADIYHIITDKKHPQHTFYKNMGVFVGIGGVTPAAVSSSTAATSPSASAAASVASTPRRTTPASAPASVANTPKHLSSKVNSSKSLKSPTSVAENKERGSSSSQMISSYTATANTTSVAAGRISFAFGLEGPCMSIDTACSSSFVALHAARRALQLGECNVAIVAGVNLIDEKLSLACAIAGMTSSDGLCHTFDASADGYGRGEGCGVIILKRKQDCYRDGQRMYTIIKGSAIQQDGASASLTAPNGLAQESVLQKALKDAKVSADSIRLIEAHGTGTQYGDPVEIASIVNVFGNINNNPNTNNTRSDKNPLYVTAIKANIGHLEACAGLAGLFAVILSFQQEVSFPNAKLNELNPLIQQSLQSCKEKVIISSEAHHLTRYPSKNQEERGRKSRFLAGISSFGYSGTIAHVIVEEPKTAWQRCVSTQKGFTLGRNAVEEAIGGESLFEDDKATESNQVKERQIESTPAAMGASPSDAMEFAKFFFGVKSFKPVQSSKKSRNAKTETTEKGEGTAEEEETDSDGFSIPRPSQDVSFVDSPLTSSTPTLPEQPSSLPMTVVDDYEPSDPHLLWQFSGQGNLKVNSGETFYQQNEVYRSTLQQCAAIAQQWLEGINFLDILYPGVNKLNSLTKATELMTRTRYSQVILIAMEYSLAQALFAKGIYPAAVTGHSLGEYTAAMFAGVMTLEEGLYLVSQRGKLIEEHHQQCCGKMVAIRADLTELEEKMKNLPSAISAEISIAGVNGYNSLVLSGSERAVTAALKQLNITTAIPLAVKHAFHSPLLKSIVPKFTEVIKTIQWKPFTKKKLAYFSTYLGKQIVSNENNHNHHALMTEEYWIGHMIERVNYVKMIEAAVSGISEGEEEEGNKEIKKQPQQQYYHLMEIGPEKVLMKLSQSIVKTLQTSSKFQEKLKGLEMTNGSVLE